MNYEHEDYSCCQSHCSVNADHSVPETLQINPPHHPLQMEIQVSMKHYKKVTGFKVSK
jgi:hypothetical protein